MCEICFGIVTLKHGQHKIFLSRHQLWGTVWWCLFSFVLLFIPESITSYTLILEAPLETLWLMFVLSFTNLFIGFFNHSRHSISFLSVYQMMMQLARSSWILHLSCNKRRVAPIAALLSAILHPAIFSNLEMHKTSEKGPGPLKWVSCHISSFTYFTVLDATPLLFFNWVVSIHKCLAAALLLSAHLFASSAEVAPFQYMKSALWILCACILYRVTYLPKRCEQRRK